MDHTLSNSIVLITGGTGTFGKAFLDRCLKAGAKEVRIFSRDEKKQYDMMQRYHGQNVRFFIGDIRDKKTIDYAMVGVDYVFHAAAMKQIPLCEQFPMEAIKTNVIGSKNVLDSSIENSVKKVVFLSTDKAVNPTSMMGLTKASMEKIVLQAAKEQNKTQLYITRFCNLIASNGSVVPLFINQIKNNQPITITDPNMTRFMMSINDATNLVELALVNGHHGDILIKAGKPCKIGDLAKAVCVFSNTIEDYPIKIIGARPGEKIYESLLAPEEEHAAKIIDEYICIPYLKEEGSKPCNFEASNYMEISEIIEMIKTCDFWRE